MQEETVAAQPQGDGLPDFHSPIARMVQDTAMSGDDAVISELVTALGFGLELLASMCATPEMAQTFVDRFCMAAKIETEKRYPDMEEARSVYGAIVVNEKSNLH